MPTEDQLLKLNPKQDAIPKQARKAQELYFLPLNQVAGELMANHADLAAELFTKYGRDATSALLNIKQSLAKYLIETHPDYKELPEYKDTPPGIGLRAALSSLSRPTFFKGDVFKEYSEAHRTYMQNFNIGYLDSKGDSTVSLQDIKENRASLNNIMKSLLKNSHRANEAKRKDMLTLFLHFQTLLQKMDAQIEALKNIQTLKDKGTLRYYTAVEPENCTDEKAFNEWLKAVNEGQPVTQKNKQDEEVQAGGKEPLIFDSLRITAISSGWIVYPPSSRFAESSVDEVKRTESIFSQRIKDGSPYEMIVYSIPPNPPLKFKEALEAFKQSHPGTPNPEIEQMLCQMPEAERILSTIMANGVTPSVPIEWVKNSHLAMAIHVLIETHGLQDKVQLDESVYKHHEKTPNQDKTTPVIDIRESSKEFIHWQKEQKAMEAPGQPNANVIHLTRESEKTLVARDNLAVLSGSKRDLVPEEEEAEKRFVPVDQGPSTHRMK